MGAAVREQIVSLNRRSNMCDAAFYTTHAPQRNLLLWICSNLEHKGEMCIYIQYPKYVPNLSCLTALAPLYSTPR